MIFGHFASFSLLRTVLALPNEASRNFSIFFSGPKNSLPRDRDFRANGTLLGQGEVEKVGGKKSKIFEIFGFSPPVKGFQYIEAISPDFQTFLELWRSHAIVTYAAGFQALAAPWDIVRILCITCPATVG